MAVPFEAKIRTAQRDVNKIRHIIGDVRAATRDANDTPFNIPFPTDLDQLSTKAAIVKLRAVKAADLKQTATEYKRNSDERQKLINNRLATVGTAIVDVPIHILKHAATEGAINQINVTLPFIPKEPLTQAARGVANYGEFATVLLPIATQIAKERRNLQRGSLDRATTVLHKAEWEDAEQRFIRNRATALLQRINGDYLGESPALAELLTPQVRSDIELLHTRQQIHALGKHSKESIEEKLIAQDDYVPTTEEVSTYRKAERLAIAALVEDYVVKDQSGWTSTPEGRMRIYDLLDATNKIQANRVRAWNRPDALHNLTTLIDHHVYTGPQTSPENREKARQVIDELNAIQSRRGRRAKNIDRDLDKLGQLVRDMTLAGELTPTQTADLLQARYDLATPILDKRDYQAEGAILVDRFYRMTQISHEQRAKAVKAQRVIDAAVDLMDPQSEKTIMGNIIGALPSGLQARDIFVGRFWKVITDEVPSLADSVKVLRGNDFASREFRKLIATEVVGSSIAEGLEIRDAERHARRARSADDTTPEDGLEGADGALNRVWTGETQVRKGFNLLRRFRR